jgi:hypothetical protein
MKYRIQIRMKLSIRSMWIVTRMDEWMDERMDG